MQTIFDMVMEMVYVHTPLLRLSVKTIFEKVTEMINMHTVSGAMIEMIYMQNIISHHLIGIR